MKMKFKLFSLLFLSCIIWSCQKDNFDEIEISPNPQEPVEIVIGENLLKYQLQSQVEYPSGYGVVQRDTIYGINLYGIASAEFECDPINELGFSISAPFNSFFISFFTVNGEVIPSVATVQEIIDGDTLSYYNSFLLDSECVDSLPFIVDIEEETDEFIKGTYQTEFFKIIDSSLSEVDCEDWESVGILTAEFAVPLNVCM